MGRHQRGHVFEAHGAFHVRYYLTEIVDGQPKRVQRSHRLCAKDNKHFSVSCKAVRLLQDEFMRTVNTTTGTEAADMLVTDFWEQRYLPFVTANMKPSTVSGYKQIWNQHLKTHFTGRTLQEYKTHLGSAFLLSLTKTQGRRTLNHIRSLASGIFTHAVNEGRLDVNPWSGVKILGKVLPPKPTPHYTLEEAENIITALVDRVDCQTVIALSFFAGLRPSEISGLKWEDVDGPAIHIRRACVRGVIGTPKTPESVATLPLIPQVRVPLELWRTKSGGKKEGWVFPNERGNPQDLKDLVARIIRPAVQKAGHVWKGLYAGRRGAATAIIGLTNGNFAAAQELLRHKHMSTTLQFYKKQTATALADGLKALGAAAGKKSGEE
jgi:integrase